MAGITLHSVRPLKIRPIHIMSGRSKDTISAAKLTRTAPQRSKLFQTAIFLLAADSSSALFLALYLLAVYQPYEEVPHYPI